MREASARKRLAEARIEHTQWYAFSADEGTDVGVDEGTPVTEDYKQHENRFTGKIQKVTIELKETRAANTEGAEKVMRET